MEITKYPDGSSYVTVHPISEFTFRLNNYEDVWHLNQTVDALNNLGITPTVTIPNLLDAQADRRFAKNQSSGLKLICKFLNSMKADFKVFHPHNGELVEGLMDSVKIIDNFGFIGRILSEHFNNGKGIHGEFQNNLVLFSSDAGGFKPLMKLADKLQWKGEVYGASKSRKYEDGKSKLVQVVDREDFRGKDVLIIDDLMIGGSTFVGLAKMLKERNCGRLYLALSHITIESPNAEIWKLFDRVFTTNSKGLDYIVTVGSYDKYGKKPKNLIVVDLF
jgi:ribose-phosphate pyrophosphokinase